MHGSKAGDLLAEWDPYTIPMLTEVAGVVKFGDILEGVTMEEKVDERTGLSTKVVIDSKDLDKRPRVSIKDKDGKTQRLPSSENYARYPLPVGAHINVTEGQAVGAGDIIAKIPRETTKTKDITGGLPRVAELFEARKPKEFAVISEIDGTVSFGKDTKGKRKVIVTPEVGEPREYLIPKGKHISVHEGDRVRAGEALMDGVVEPARHPDDPWREGAGEVPGRRGAGDLPVAGRAHQRQAHRGDRAPDAASCAHQGSR